MYYHHESWEDCLEIERNQPECGAIIVVGSETRQLDARVRAAKPATPFCWRFGQVIRAEDNNRTIPSDETYSTSCLAV